MHFAAEFAENLSTDFQKKKETRLITTGLLQQPLYLTVTIEISAEQTTVKL